MSRVGMASSSSSSSTGSWADASGAAGRERAETPRAGQARWAPAPALELELELVLVPELALELELMPALVRELPRPAWAPRRQAPGVPRPRRSSMSQPPYQRHARPAQAAAHGPGHPLRVYALPTHSSRPHPQGAAHEVEAREARPTCPAHTRGEHAARATEHLGTARHVRGGESRRSARPCVS